MATYNQSSVTYSSATTTYNQVVPVVTRTGSDTATSSQTAIGVRICQRTATDTASSSQTATGTRICQRTATDTATSSQTATGLRTCTRTGTSTVVGTSTTVCTKTSYRTGSDTASSNQIGIGFYIDTHTSGRFGELIVGTSPTAVVYLEPVGGTTTEPANLGWIEPDAPTYRQPQGVQ